MTNRNKNVFQALVCGYPISIFFIVVNEFCERFSYYGMRAVLVLYFKYFLRWDDDFATTIYHTFVALCYLTPILGAIVADSWLGKFKTIVYLSIVYALGQVVLAVSAIHDITDNDRDGTPDNMAFHVALSMVGLLLIALGTGGIKPCVAAFGGDQFEDHQEKQRSTFFSIFYLSINAGSLLSTVITPILRAQECGIHSQQKCYPLAFGVPAALMVVALIVFIVGSQMYNKTAPQGNIMVKVCKCIGFAISNRFRHRHPAYPKREHWMDWAEERYDKLLIAQVKMVVKVLFLYIPLPMFWALFDQQGSRWTLQATTMDGDFVSPSHIAPRQTVNPILILILVPIVDSLVYPLISKCKLNFSPLKRMTTGMFLAALAFVAAGLVQIQIDQTLPTFPLSTQSQVKVLNMLDRPLDITAGSHSFKLDAFTANNDYLTFDDSFSLELGPGAFYPITLSDASRNTLVILQDGPLPRPVVFDDITAKPEQGANAIRFFNGLGSTLNITIGNLDFNGVGASNMSKYLAVPHGKYVTSFIFRQCIYNQQLGFGSSYTLVIPPTFTFGPNVRRRLLTQVPLDLYCSNKLVYVQTVTSSQAPSNMKSVLQAGWLLTVAVGNIIVLIVAEAATLEDQWAEYILFASLLVAVCISFAIMGYFYTYTDPSKIEAHFREMEPNEKRKNMDGKDRVQRHNEEKCSDSSSDEEEESTQTKL
uniref:Solute carrier family 15 member 1 n=1 Tax=Hippocampus comes TaxID=109280 RepID=A0A3Q2YYY4_HIPCM